MSRSSSPSSWPALDRLALTVTLLGGLSLSAGALTAQASPATPPPAVLPVLIDRALPMPFDSVPRAARDTSGRTESRRRAPRWEYGVLMMGHFGGIYRWAGPEREFKESGNPIEFLEAVGAEPGTRMRAGRTQEEIHAAILEQFGLGGWDVVTCQFIRELGTGSWRVANVTTCHLKRPLELAP
jgi:hypothetical protein